MLLILNMFLKLFCLCKPFIKVRLSAFKVFAAAKTLNADNLTLIKGLQRQNNFKNIFKMRSIFLTVSARNLRSFTQSFVNKKLIFWKSAQIFLEKKKSLTRSVLS